jgi:hypothetical protein
MQIPSYTQSKKNTAITLTELLVAVVLIGIVFLTIVSFTFSIRQFQSHEQKISYLSMRVIQTMIYIKRDGMKAIGDSSNFGIFPYEDSDDHSICFRQDVMSTPSNYGDDMWRCYALEKSTHMLWRCPLRSVKFNPVAGQGWAQICPNDNTRQAMTYIAKGSEHFFNVPYDSSNRLKYIEINLSSSDHPGLDPGPLNPSYNMTIKINPPGQSS